MLLLFKQFKKKKVLFCSLNLMCFMFILVVELNLAKCRLPKVQNLFLSFETSNARKISLEGVGIKILGTQGWEKLGGGRIFFPSSRGGLTLDDTMAYC